MNKKSWLVLFLFLIVLSSFVQAAIPPPADPFSMFSKVLPTLKSLFTLNFKDAVDFVVTMRILVWLVLFTIIYWVLRRVGGRIGLQNNAMVVVALILPSMSIMFMPSSILLSIGLEWGLIGALIMRGIIIAPLVYIIATMPDTAAGHFTRFFALVTLMYLLWSLAYQFNTVVAVYSNLPGWGSVKFAFIPILFRRSQK